jgi:aspartyl-tRNA(Asn)/glutamyl-tRNA(Gln) amidotransferase subunit A
MASSFDQVGVLTKTVADARLLLNVIAGYDENDSQSDKKADTKDFLVASKMLPSEIKIAIPNEAFTAALDPRVEKLFREKIAELKEQGYQVDFVDFPILKQVAPIYYMLISAEVTSNLSRFDGVRFGLQKSMADFSSLQEYYTAVRSEGFGNEVKKRMLLGNYVVMHENYEKYYKKGYQARRFLQQEFTKFFQQYHVILTPTTPTPAGKIGEKVNNSLLMYLEDLYTVPANLAGLPAISLPMGVVEEGNEKLPVGIQLMGPKWKEGLLLDIAEGIEEE